MIARLLGRRLLGVQIVPRPETRIEPSAHVPAGAPRTDAERAALEGELMIAVGGLAAERVLGLLTDSALAGAMNDLGRAAELGLRLSGPARARQTVAHFLSVTEKMLRERAEVVRVAAHRLADVKRLDQPELDQLLPRR